MSELIQIKVVKNDKYVVMDLTNVLDPNLSWKAKGIFTYLISRPPNWALRTRDLVNRSTDGRDRFTTGLAELIAAGYVHRYQIKDELGRFGQWVYWVFETPKTVEEFKELVHDETDLPSENSETGFSEFGDPGGIVFKRIVLSNNEDEHSPSENYLPSEDNLLQENDGVSDETRHTPEILPSQEIRYKPTLKIPSHCMDIINYWNNSPGLSKLRIPDEQDIHGGYIEPTKKLVETVKRLRLVIRGEFFDKIPELASANRPFHVDEIKSRIYNFHLKASNPDYAPMNKDRLKKTSLVHFLYNPFVGFNGTPDGKPSGVSYFMGCAEWPELVKNKFVRPVTEISPDWTNRLIRSYYNTFRGDSAPEKISQIQRNKFIHGGNRLYNMARVLNRKMGIPLTVGEWCEYTMKALEKGFKDVGVGNVGSDYTYDELLPAYLIEVGRLPRKGESSNGRKLYE